MMADLFVAIRDLQQFCVLESFCHKLDSLGQTIARKTARYRDGRQSTGVAYALAADAVRERPRTCFRERTRADGIHEGIEVVFLQKIFEQFLQRRTAAIARGVFWIFFHR